MSGVRATGRRRQPVLHIDWTACDGRGLCTELLSGRLTRDPWGYPVTGASGNDLPLAPSELDAAREAVALCPKLALKVLLR